jgi:nitrate/TMAO reductase-like tetraheme cytochrome c subunit
VLPLRLPDAVRNPVSLIGIAVTTAMAMLFIVFLLLEVFGYLTNPYIGLLIFVAIPALFILGLLSIPAGAWWWARRRRNAPDLSQWPILDLRDSRQRTTLVVVLSLTIVNVVLVSLAAYGGVHYMDSSAFCGQVCHTTMEPQYRAYQVGPHARVACAQCHVGPGAGAFVEAKLAGARQLAHVLTGSVPKPVPSPQDLLRPARDTCEQCHWPEKFHGDKIRVVREYSNDEKNTETATTLELHVGGGSSALGVGEGVHWHMNLDNQIEFVATDARNEVIPYVRVSEQGGRVTEYVSDAATPEQIAAGTRRRMDCMDCHNRPAHTFQFTPERAVDTAIAQRRIPRELPFVRREAVAAVSAPYPDRSAALAEIERRLRDFYRTQSGASAPLVGRAVAATQEVWARNVFPAMNVTWGTYVNHLGHVDTPGCFRCHDDNHKSADGRVISQDCELCHRLP